MEDSDRLAVQYADRDCPVFHGLSSPELTIAGATCALISLLLAITAAALAGIWLLPLVFFAGLTLGVRLCAVIADRLRDGKPSGWLERHLAWRLRHWLLPPSIPTESGSWLPRRLSS